MTTDLLGEKIEIGLALVFDIAFCIVTFAVAIKVIIPCGIVFPFLLLVIVVIVIKGEVAFLGDFFAVCTLLVA